MAYQVLARKWRPRQFEDIVGQEHIARTLQNAILTNRVAHAYLFNGLRGIGKTSAARVFAKALRCLNPQNGNPCDACESCHEITEGRAVDVLEIDGASNNSVDNIREIRENARYLPSSGKLKIYIIDEVHMLSTSAFNALLKTLEEPPEHVMFLFATTEVQKIPATILSRCQRFDFKRASTKQVIERLQKIAKEENIEADPNTFALIARESEGSIRDSLSLFDQVISFCQPISKEGENPTVHLNFEDTIKALGVVDRLLVLTTLKAIIEHSPLLAAEQVGKVYHFGYDIKQFSKELFEVMRALTLIKLSNDEIEKFLELPDNEIQEMKSLAQSASSETLQLLFKILSENIDLSLKSINPRVSLEMLLIRLATIEPIESFSSLFKRVKSEPTISRPSQISPPIATASPTWVGFIEHLKKSNPPLGFSLESSNLVDPSLNNSELIIGFPEDEGYSLETARTNENQALLAREAKLFFKNPNLKIEIRVLKKKSSQFKTINELKEEKRDQDHNIRKTQIKNHELIQSAKDVFQVDLTDIVIEETE